MTDVLIGLLAGAFVSGVGVVLYFVSQKKQGAQHEALKIESLLASEKKSLSDREARLLDQQKRFEEEKVRFDADRKRFETEQKDVREKRTKVDEIEMKLIQREDRLEQKMDELSKKQQALQEKESHLEKIIADQERVKVQLQEKLAQISGLSADEARKILLQQIEERYEKDILILIEKKKTELKLREKELAREILIKAIQQYSGDVTTETTQTIIHLENDDLKWKLIGKEGRNIIAFERATGVSLIIDDAPDTVFISSFDLFRRYIAKKSLEQLIEDKRIQPARIEEIVEQNQKEADKLIFDLGEKTLNEMGITGIHEEISSLIGKLRFRTSYGQNILIHAKEVAYIAEAIAKEIGADASIALRAGLLHDIGKAVDHDIEGTHPEIGARIARKHGLPEKIINAIESHHDDVPQTCIESKIVQIADAISSIRPGARRMNVEQYLKRIQEMENIAMSFSGVSKAYALSAGREVRIFVDALTISDYDAEKLAQEIALSIEANSNYPGEVKITLIREKRVIEYAR